MARTTFEGPIHVGRKGSTNPTVTQTTNRFTAVTINAPSGEIVMDSTSLAAGAEATFTVNNSFVKSTSVPVIALARDRTAATSVVDVTGVADGSFNITISNQNAATADTGADVINFIIFGGVAP